jgi:hypothetical protein
LRNPKRPDAVHQLRRLTVVGALALALAGCASHYSPEVFADPYGLFSGIWHGLMLPITIWVVALSWLLSLVGIDFFSDVTLWGIPNTGFGYWFGFANGLVLAVVIGD